MLRSRRLEALRFLPAGNGGLARASCVGLKRHLLRPQHAGLQPPCADSSATWQKTPARPSVEDSVEVCYFPQGPHVTKPPGAPRSLQPPKGGPSCEALACLGGPGQPRYLDHAARGPALPIRHLRPLGMPWLAAVGLNACSALALATLFLLFLWVFSKDWGHGSLDSPLRSPESQ